MNLSILTPSTPLSSLRVGALSTTLSLHLLAFGLLIIPPHPASLRPAAVTPDVLIADFVARVTPRSEPVPPIPPPPQRPQPQPRTPPLEPTVVPVRLAESAFAVPVAPALPQPASAVSETYPSPVSSASAEIAYDIAPPPPYPPIAIRRGWEGTVLLRVRVDANGRPLEVQVERSSGYAALDRGASAHVLKRWRFQPAHLDGRPAVAWARVPIGFRLDRG
jgi:protein TonB